MYPTPEASDPESESTKPWNIDTSSKGKVGKEEEQVQQEQRWEQRNEQRQDHQQPGQNQNQQQ